MPDGDRFERTLRGGGWRSAYRLATGGATDQRVAEKVARACTSLIDADAVSCAAKHVNALRGALKAATLPLFPGEFPPERFRNLTHEIDGIAGDHGFGEFAQTCGRAASSCFCAMESEPAPSSAQIERTFAKSLIRDIVLNFFLARTRDGIAFNTRRNELEQHRWELSLLDCLEPIVEKFAQGLSSGRQTRLALAKEFASTERSFNHQQRLHEPLRILEAL